MPTLHQIMEKKANSNLLLLVGALFLYLIFQISSPIGTKQQSSSFSPTSTADEINPTSETLNHVIDASQITADEINPYLTGVGKIMCYEILPNGELSLYDIGSGSLWRMDDGDFVVTNNHVIETNFCRFSIGGTTKDSRSGTYDLDLKHQVKWNDMADVSVIPILDNPAYTSNDSSEHQLNYIFSSLRFCPSSITQGSPVMIVGYPKSSTSYGVFGLESRTINNGIISGTRLPLPLKLPNDDYLVSAKTDSGNSGGVALSKDREGLCLLGIATWVSTGNYENTGIVQNIHNITWTQ